MTERHVAELACKKAGDSMQRILLDLDEKVRGYGVEVSGVEIDTRRFANMAVNINID